jgi:hypothetical protein
LNSEAKQHHENIYRVYDAPSNRTAVREVNANAGDAPTTQRTSAGNDSATAQIVKRANTRPAKEK